MISALPILVIQDYTYGLMFNPEDKAVIIKHLAQEQKSNNHDLKHQSLTLMSRSQLPGVQNYSGDATEHFSTM